MNATTLNGDMTHWTCRKIMVLLLGVFVTLGMGLSTVQASTMAFKMTMTSEMGSSDHSDCGGCGSGGDGAKAMVCMPGCVVSVPALPSQADATGLSLPPVSFRLQNFLMISRVYPPDPYPPRFSDIG